MVVVKVVLLVGVGLDAKLHLAHTVHGLRSGAGYGRLHRHVRLHCPFERTVVVEVEALEQRDKGSVKLGKTKGRQGSKWRGTKMVRLATRNFQAVAKLTTT